MHASWWSWKSETCRQSMQISDAESKRITGENWPVSHLGGFSHRNAASFSVCFCFHRFDTWPNRLVEFHMPTTDTYSMASLAISTFFMSQMWRLTSHRHQLMHGMCHRAGWLTGWLTLSKRRFFIDSHLRTVNHGWRDVRITQMIANRHHCECDPRG